MSKIGSLLGMNSKARQRRAPVDIAKVAGTKMPRVLFDAFGGSDIPILESAFSKWEDLRHRKTALHTKKQTLDERLHNKKSGASNTDADKMVQEAKKSRRDAEQAAQAQTSHAREQAANTAAMADQASVSTKLLEKIYGELSEIKGVLHVGGRQVGTGATAGSSGGGILNTIEGLGGLLQYLPGKMKGKLLGKLAGGLEKVGLKKLSGHFAAKAAEHLGGEEIAEHAAPTAVKVGEGLLKGGAATAAASGLGDAAKAAGGGILGKLGGFGRSALSAASGAVESGKGALAKVWGATGGKVTGLIQKVGAKEGIQIGDKEAAEIGGKMLAKEGGKAIPLLGEAIGLVTNLGFAAKRAWHGDYSGAAMETGSGLLNLIPGVGNYLSIAADGAIAVRDMKKASAAKGGSGSGGGGPSYTAPKPINWITGGQGPKPPGPAVPPGVRAITAATKHSAAMATASTAAAASTTSDAQTVLSGLADTMTEMFGLMADPTKGIYVQAANNPLANNVTPVFSNTSNGSRPGVVTPRQPGAAKNGGWVHHAAGGPTEHIGPVSNEVGSISARYESNGSSTSIGNDATGGASYGKFQIATKTGTMSKFMDYLKTNNPKAYAALAPSVGSAGDGKHGAFGQAWEKAAKSGILGDSEHGFIKSTHFDPAAQGILKDTGLDVSKRSKAVQDALWSTAVQNGPGGAKHIFDSVLKGKDASKMSDADLIQAVNKERGADNGEKYFGHSSAAVRASVLNRFKNENKDELAELSASKQGANKLQAAPVNTASQIDQSTEEVASAGDKSQQPIIVQLASTGGGGSGGSETATGTGSGASGPMITRNDDSSVRRITDNFMSGSSAMS